ncbi:MAG: nitrate reductase [Candidatus Zixiibacteriota bacterium]|nr:MAG: nitrate reductase [candidate division Zixibacteria bacterium]
MVLQWLVRQTLKGMVLLWLATPLVVTATPANTITGDTTNTWCLRCHGMATLGYLDAGTGKIVSLSVDSVRFGHSNHAELNCTECHSTTFRQFPHPDSLKKENLYCLDCHKDLKKFGRFQFPQIEKEFEASMHRQRLGDKYTCFSCHNPHEFRIHADTQSVATIVRKDNGICLNCHNSPELFKTLTKRQFPVLSLSHSWLPNTQLHWQHVRCVDCHTAPDDSLIHQILPADSATRNCVQCHTANSLLIAKLYRYRTTQERQKRGFINSALLNNAYVVGTTRNVILDRLSIILFLLVVLGIGGHGLGRALGAKRRRPHE